MTEILAFALTLLPIAGIWATWKLWGWARRLHSRFLWGLVWASVFVDISTLPILFISVRRLVLGPDVPAIQGSGEVIGVSLIILESIFIYLVWRWRDLDDYVEDQEPAEHERGDHP